MADYFKLKSLIDADSTNTVLTNDELRAKLQVQKTAKLNNKKYDALDLINLLPAGLGGSILAKIKSVAAAESESGELKWVIAAITLRGLEIGAKTTQQDLAKLVSVGVILQTEYDALNAIATESVLDILDAGFAVIDVAAIAKARSL